MVAERFPDTPLLTMSALKGDGVDAWLNVILRDQPAGQRIAEVDYDTYAEGEAELGWLNASVELRADGGGDWRPFCLDLVSRMRNELQAASAEIAHVKLYLGTFSGSLVANVTSTRGEPSVRGRVVGTPQEADLTLNARVHMGPGELREVAERSLHASAGDRIKVRIKSIRNFSPARPEPTHRFESVM